MAQLRREEARFQALGARVVLVGSGTVAQTAAFKARFAVPFPMIADPEKRLFRAFQLKRASITALLSMGMALKGVSAMTRGHGLGIPQGDMRQLPGVFVIGGDGRLRYRYFARDAADHPPVGTLIAALRSSGVAAEGPQAPR